MRAAVFVVLGLLLVLGAGFVLVVGQRPAPPAPASQAEAPVARISIDADGHITLDGAEATLEEVRTRLAEVAEQGGRVWYHRADIGGDPPDVAVDVLQAIIDNRLPVRLAMEPDFSDVDTAEESR